MNKGKFFGPENGKEKLCYKTIVEVFAPFDYANVK